MPLPQMEDNKRSIPCLVDGFKPSQRKVLFSCFKRNLKKEIKVCTYAEVIRDISNQNTNTSICVRLLDSLNINIKNRELNVVGFRVVVSLFFFVWCGFVSFTGAFFLCNNKGDIVPWGRLACC